MRNLPAELAGQATVTSLGNTETTVLSITDIGHLVKPVLSIFAKPGFGSNTYIDLRYYAAYVPNPAAASTTDWYKLFNRGAGTTTTGLNGVIAVGDFSLRLGTDQVRVVDTISHYLKDQPLPACAAFKITAKGDSGSNDGSVSVAVMVQEA